MENETHEEVYINPTTGEIVPKAGQLKTGSCQFAPGNQLHKLHTGIISDSQRMKKALKAVCKPEDLREIFQVIIEQAKRGNTKAQQLLFDRYGGKATESIEIKSENTNFVLDALLIDDSVGRTKIVDDAIAKKIAESQPKKTDESQPKKTDANLSC
jgi:hypothetical protein